MSLSSYRVGAVAAVSDLERAREFYEGKLGLVPSSEGPEGAGVLYRAAADTEFFVYVSRENAGSSKATLASWAVDDVEKVVEELSAKGVVFEQYDEDPIKTDERGVCDLGEFKVAWLKDPDGNIHALNG